VKILLYIIMFVAIALVLCEGRPTSIENYCSVYFNSRTEDHITRSPGCAPADDIDYRVIFQLAIAWKSPNFTKSPKSAKQEFGSC
jgi:hypothetical protein